MLEIANSGPDVKTSGTSLQGFIETTYHDLSSVLGDPAFIEDYPEEKVSCQWQIELDNGSVCTIYSWKTGGRVPFGPYNWHVGAHRPEVFDELLEALEDAGIEVIPSRR